MRLLLEDDRRGTLLNMMGEKTSEHATHQALTDTLSAHFPLSDYSVVEDTRTLPGRYAFFVEFPSAGGARPPR